MSTKKEREAALAKNFSQDVPASMFAGPGPLPAEPTIPDAGAERRDAALAKNFSKDVPASMFAGPTPPAHRPDFNAAEEPAPTTSEHLTPEAEAEEWDRTLAGVVAGQSPEVAAEEAQEPTSKGVGRLLQLPQLPQLPDDLVADPFLYVGKLCRKVGVIAIISGIAAYVIAQAGQRADQYLLTDMDNRLGIPNQTTPNTPAPPPPVPTQYQIDISNIVNQLANLSVTSAIDVANSLWSAISSALDLQTYLQSNGGPAQTQNDVQNLISDLSGALAAMGYVPSGYQTYADQQLVVLVDSQNFISAAIAAATAGSIAYLILEAELTNVQALETQYANVISAYNDQQAGGTFTPNWPTAQNLVSSAMADANAVAVDLGGVAPFSPVPTSSTSSTSSSSSASGSIFQQAFQFTFGDAATADVFGAANYFQKIVFPGLVNIPSEVGGFANAVVSGAEALVGDVENALKILGNAIVNFPIIAADGIAYVAILAVTTIAADIWQPLIYGGLGLFAASLFMLEVWPHIKPRVSAFLNARANAIYQRLDEYFNTRQNIRINRQEQQVLGEIDQSMVKPIIVPPVIGGNAAPVQATPRQEEIDIKEDVPAKEATPPPPPPNITNDAQLKATFKDVDDKLNTQQKFTAKVAVENEATDAKAQVLAKEISRIREYLKNNRHDKDDDDHLAAIETGYKIISTTDILPGQTSTIVTGGDVSGGATMEERPIEDAAVVQRMVESKRVERLLAAGMPPEMAGIVARAAASEEDVEKELLAYQEELRLTTEAEKKEIAKQQAFHEALESGMTPTAALDEILPPKKSVKDRASRLAAMFNPPPPDEPPSDSEEVRKERERKKKAQE